MILCDVDIDSALHARARQRSLIEGRGPRVSEFLLNSHRFGGGSITPTKMALLHFEGSNGSTTFTDEVGNTWTGAGGGATISTAQFYFGASSLNLNGSSRITTPIANLPFGTADFTIACWVRPSSAASYQNIFNSRGSLGGGLTFRITNGAKLEFFYGAGSGSMTGPTSLTATTWQHVALTRSGSTFRTFLNGVLQSTSGTITANMSTNAHSVGTIGCYGQANAEFFSGYMDEYLIASNCLWTSNFTPPAVPWS